MRPSNGGYGKAGGNKVDDQRGLDTTFILTVIIACIKIVFMLDILSQKIIIFVIIIRKRKFYPNYSSS